MLLTHYVICSCKSYCIPKHFDLQEKAKAKTDISKIDWDFCVKYNSLRPSNAFHCIYCDMYILDYHHHCPYLGICMSKKMIRYFKVFPVILIVVSLGVLCCIIVRCINPVFGVKTVVRL
ncbi:putative ZDHHC-type palmitoyltransferase 4 [Penaeus monodon]|uniref:putative ZDHHC-type palmitoyltransferase 4 n=1 Tax=Penaeus monodon TaxID=6687 RepID=UPI0018A71EC5|nr:putative ZDHHC-type palmitoyltransferase 4 [Penaeus monodon]